MRETNVSSRLLGYVQLRVGARIIAVPVQSMKLERDGRHQPGGFYVEGSQFGIYVDDEAAEDEVAEQIRAGSNEAVLHITKKIFN
jgi:hypothetical protein